MLKEIQLMAILTFLILTTGWCQNQAVSETEIKHTTLSLDIGVGFFQNLKLDLKNFKQETIATADDLIPTLIKAHFNYHLTPHVILRFTSGYGYAKQANLHEVDYSLLDSMDVKTITNSIFSIAGFPLETTLIFQTAIDKEEHILPRIGIGWGYYSYNLKAEGQIEEISPQSHRTRWKEEYQNPALTLSGWAQFLVLGLELKFSPRLGAHFEVSKIGLCYLKLESDIIQQQIYNHEVEYELKYGYQKQDYRPRSGLEDLAISAGVHWKL